MSPSISMGMYACSVFSQTWNHDPKHKYECLMNISQQSISHFQAYVWICMCSIPFSIMPQQVSSITMVLPSVGRIYIHTSFVFPLLVTHETYPHRYCCGNIIGHIYPISYMWYHATTIRRQQPVWCTYVYYDTPH